MTTDDGKNGNPRNRLPVRLDAEVVENRHEGGGNWRLVVKVADWPDFRPGQFVMVSPGPRADVERWDPLLPRPMAIYRLRRDGGSTQLEILYKVSGRGTGLLAEAVSGQRVRLVGPLGCPFPAIEAGSGLRRILVGGGTGIASLFDLAARALEVASDPTGVQVLLGARSAEDLLGADDFETLGVTLSFATEDGSRGHRGFVTELLEQCLDADPDSMVYACGPTPMMERCAGISSERGVTCIVSLENRMACGFGVCLGCAAPVGSEGYALVCREGPVFDAATVRWGEMP